MRPRIGRIQRQRLVQRRDRLGGAAGFLQPAPVAVIARGMIGRKLDGPAELLPRLLQMADLQQQLA